MKKLFLLFLSSLLISVSQGQWKADTRLSNDANESASPFVCAGGSLVHVVWFDNRDGNNEIYYKRSSDAGITWGTDTRLTNDPGLSYYPAMALSGNTIHLVWQERRDGNDEIYYKKSTDGGLTWGADTRLTNDAAASSTPSIAVFGSVIHVVWYDLRDGNNEIYYKKSTDGGATWGTDTRLTNNNATSVNASIAISGSSLHVIWTDNRDGNNEIYYKRSTDAGVNWGADTRLTNNTANSDFASITATGITVHIAWADYRDNNLEIYYKKSADGGLNWGTDTRLTNEASMSASMYPSITVSGAIVHVLWQENRDGNFEIYFKRSLNAGVAWGTDTRITNNAGISRKPMVYAAGSGIHTVWYDDRDGNDEIYYSRDTSFRQTGIRNINPSSEMKLYPNPVAGSLHIYFFEFNESSSTEISICNILGEEMLRSKMQVRDTLLDLSELNEGVYFVNMINENHIIQCRKISVVH